MPSFEKGCRTWAIPADQVQRPHPRLRATAQGVGQTMGANRIPRQRGVPDPQKRDFGLPDTRLKTQPRQGGRKHTRRPRPADPFDHFPALTIP